MAVQAEAAPREGVSVQEAGGRRLVSWWWWWWCSGRVTQVFAFNNKASQFFLCIFSYFTTKGKSEVVLIYWWVGLLLSINYHKYLTY